PPRAHDLFGGTVEHGVPLGNVCRGQHLPGPVGPRPTDRVDRSALVLGGPRRLGHRLLRHGRILPPDHPAPLTAFARDGAPPVPAHTVATVRAGTGGA